MTTEYIVRPLKIAVAPKGDPIFSERVTTIEIVDESAGEHLKVTQQSMHPDIERQQIFIEEDEWPALRIAIDQMVSEIKKNKPKESEQ